MDICFVIYLQSLVSDLNSLRPGSQGGGGARSFGQELSGEVQCVPKEVLWPTAVPLAGQGGRLQGEVLHGRSRIGGQV